VSYFRRFLKIARSDYQLCHYRLSARLHGQLSSHWTDFFVKYDIFSIFSELCGENSDFFTIWNNGYFTCRPM